MVRVESRLVNLNVSIPVDISTDRTKLGKEDFTVYENGEQQEVKFFSAGEQQSVDLILMLGLRGWARNKKDLTYEYAQSFINAARPSDRIATFTFDGRNRIFSPLTKNEEKAIETTETAGSNGSGGFRTP